MEKRNKNLNSDSRELKQKPVKRTASKEEPYNLTDLGSILLNAPQEIFICDLVNLDLLFANHAALQKYGANVLNISSTRLTDLFPDITEQNFKKSIQPLKKAQTQEVQIVKKFKTVDNELINLFLTIQLTEYLNKKSAIIYVQDVGQNNSRIEELMKYEEVFNSYTNIYLETELNGNVLYITPSVKNLLGYDQREVIGLNSGSFYSDPNLRQKLIPYILEHGFINSHDVEIRHKNGSYVSVKASVKLDRNDEGEPIFKTTFHDITELKKVQHELLEKNNRLEVLQKVQKEILKSRSREDMIRSAMVSYRLLPVPTARVVVSLFDEFNDIVTLYINEEDNQIEKKKGKLTGSFTYNILKENHSKRIGLFEDLRNTEIKSILDLCNHSYICFPLLVSDKLIGALTFEFGEQLPANKEYMDLLSEISRQLAIAVNNITLNEELKSSIDRFKVLYEQDAMGVLETTMDGRILDANEKMLDILKLKGHQLYGLTIGDLAYNEADFIYEDKMIRDIVIRDQESLAFTKRFKNGEESIVYAKIWITKVKGGSGESDYLLYFVEDRTELHKAEADRLSALIEGQENERKRIAQELHDGLGQVLSVIKLNLYAVQSEFPEGNLNNLTNFADLAIKEYRAVSHNLLPPLLENNGLADALRDLCRNVSSSNTHKIKLQCDLEEEVPKVYAIETYRIIQELMNNTLKHAEAKNMYLSLSLQNNILSIDYSDDGKGFDMSEVRKDSWSMRKGIGLSNIEARVKLLSGTIDISASKNKGVAFHIQFYINEVGVEYIDNRR